MGQSIHILHVDDDPNFLDMAAEFLQREDERINIRTVTTPREALKVLAEDDFDGVVSDYDMPGQNGIEFLETVRGDHPDLPFILYTGKGSEEVASDAISAGVTDYLQKGRGTSQYTVLANRIVNAVNRYRTQTELADREQRLNLFFEQSLLGVIQWDDDFNFARVNETAEDILGYTEEELVGEPWDVVVPEENREEIGDIVVSDLLTNQGGYHSINENVRKNGERIVCEWHNRAVTDDNGDVVAIFSQFQDITERREHQRELERHRAITQAATSTIISIDETNTIQSVNTAVEETFGYASAELVGEELTVLMSEDVADQHRAAFERYRETDEKTIDWNYVEFSGQHRDGSTVPVSLSIGEVTFEGDRFFVGIVRDISEQKERDRELRRHQTFIEESLDALQDVFYVLGEDGSLIYWNDRVSEVTGYSDEELDDLEATALFAEDHREPILNSIREVLETDTDTIQADVLTGDGERIPYEFRGTRVGDPTGDGKAVAGVGRDISERRERERELEKTRERFQTIVEATNDAIFILDPDNETIVDANPQATELLGYSRDELVSSITIPDIHPGDMDQYRRFLDQVQAEELGRRSDFQCVTKAGEPKDCEISVSQADFDDNRYLIAVVRDISDRKQREQRLERFASIVSHDLRNPLRVAEGHVELAKEECDSEHLETIEGAHKRMETLIEDVLTLARGDEPITEKAKVDLSALVDGCWTNIETGDATLFSDVRRPILADESRVRQLFENLFLNAVEHGGGDVTVRVGELEDGFYVEDDGLGISDAESERVFAAGYSTREDGTGFGLNIVKQVAKAHEWQIQVTEGSEGGARFEINGVEFAAE